MNITKNLILILSIFFCSSFLLAFETFDFEKNHSQSQQKSSFVEATEDFPREEKDLRKWDAPVIADLDQDGYNDLLLNDHGFGVRVCWNNKGRFSKPFDIIMGDLHGISVGDFDLDGLQEIIISRGGGSGSNARNSKIFRVDRQRNFSVVPDFYTPLELMRGRTVKFFDGDNDGDLDLLNFAFSSREKNGKSENYIYENDGKSQLILSNTLPPSKSDGQKTLLTDINSDGIIDLCLYGQGHVKFYQGNGNLSFHEVTESVLPFQLKEVTGISEIDFDNDGDFDLYFTRGQEFEIGETFFDSETKTWGFFTKRGPFQFNDLKIGDILYLQNFQSQWPHKSIYLGETAYEYEFPGETHSGKNIRLVNSDALGFPDQVNKKGAFLGYVGNRCWRLAGDLWAPATAVIIGVEDYQKYDHRPGLSDVLLENKGGKFVDVTQSLNLQLEEHTTSSAIADLDNNGWQDIVVIRRGDLIHQNESIIYLNYGESQFERLLNHNIISPELGAIGMGVETFDYNLDGKMDVVLGNERGKWHLFKNTFQETENFLVIKVGISEKGRATPLGAIVSISSCNKKQIRRVGATGATYSLSANNFIHFGLGNCNEPTIVSVKWTNGEKMERTISAFNETVFLGKK